MATEILKIGEKDNFSIEIRNIATTAVLIYLLILVVGIIGSCMGIMIMITKFPHRIPVMNTVATNLSLIARVFRVILLKMCTSSQRATCQNI